MERAKFELRQQIIEFGDLSTSGKPLDTPVSIAADLAGLKSSHNPMQQALGDVLLNLSELRGQMLGLISTQGAASFAAESAAAEVRGLAARIFAQMNSTADPAVLSAVVSAAHFVTQAKTRFGSESGKTLIGRAEDTLKRLTLFLMESDGTKEHGNRGRRA